MPGIVTSASGFIYLITRTGVTGVGGLDIESIEANVKRVKAHTDTPVCLGFGISTADDAKKLRDIADGIVIGSAFEKIIEENLEADNIPQLLSAKVAEIKAELK